MTNYVPRCSVSLLILVVSVFILACTGSPQNSNTAPTPPPPAAPSSANPSHVYEGALDVANCDVIAGWAWDKNNPDTQINVDIYDADNLIATTPAKLFRPDLRDLGMSNGQHAFHYVTPAALKDGRPHTVHAKIASLVLMGGAKTLSCASK